MRNRRITFAIGYIIFVTVFCVLDVLFSWCGMEWRSWFEFVAKAFMWMLPLFGVCYVCHVWRERALQREFVKTGESSGALFRLGTGAILGVIWLITFVACLFIFLYLMWSVYTEERLPGGILAVSNGDAVTAARTDYYYCKPVTVFARRRVAWDDDMSISYLEAAYDDTFTAVECADGITRFESAHYPGVETSVTTTYALNDNYVNQVHVFLLTQAMEEVSQLYPDVGWEIYSDSGMADVDYFMLDCRGEQQIQEIAEAAYELLIRIKDCEVYEDEPWNRYVSFYCYGAAYPQKFYEENHYGGSLAWNDEWQVPSDRATAVASFAEKIKHRYERLGEEYAEKYPDPSVFDELKASRRQNFLEEYYEKKDAVYYQGFVGEDRELVDAAWLIYEKHYRGSSGNPSGKPYCTFNAKGNFYAVVEDGRDSRVVLVYDGMSQNGKCYLLVAEEEHYSAEGDMLDNTSLLEFYAVNLKEGKVYEAHKTTWGGAEAEDYRNATQG